MQSLSQVKRTCSISCRFINEKSYDNSLSVSGKICILMVSPLKTSLRHFIQANIKIKAVSKEKFTLLHESQHRRFKKYLFTSPVVEFSKFKHACSLLLKESCNLHFTCKGCTHLPAVQVLLFTHIYSTQ